MSCGSASVTAPVSAGEVSTRIASGSAVISCSGRVDAIPIARDGPEAVVDGDVLRLARLELLQHRRGHAIGEDVAGQQQHRQPVDRRARGAGDHVGGARTDRRRAGERPQPVRHLRERRRGVHHRLLVAALVVAQPIAHLIERLADAGDVAVAEDAEDAGKERLPPAVALAELDAQEPHQRLRHRQDEAVMFDVGVRQHHVANQLIEVGARGEELPQRPARRREAVELGQRQAVLVVRAPEVGEAAIEIVDDARADRRVDARRRPSMSLATKRFCHADGGEITTSPPIELAPVHVVAKRGRQQPVR